MKIKKKYFNVQKRFLWKTTFIYYVKANKQLLNILPWRTCATLPVCLIHFVLKKDYLYFYYRWLFFEIPGKKILVFFFNFTKRLIWTEYWYVHTYLVDFKTQFYRIIYPQKISNSVANVFFILKSICFFNQQLIYIDNRNNKYKVFCIFYIKIIYIFRH